MPIYVQVRNAPGFEDFNGTLVPGLGNVEAVDARGPLAVVLDYAGTPLVVPASCVTESSVHPSPEPFKGFDRSGLPR